MHYPATYTLTQIEFRNLKSKLTRAINSKDANKIIATCDEALNIFQEKGFPDDHFRWSRAKEDAQWSLRRTKI